MVMEIENDGVVEEMEMVKRFYIPTIKAECPSCGEMVKREHYLSYPDFNEVNEVDFFCDCGEEFIRGIFIRLEIEECTKL